MGDDRQYAPATLRNRDFILDVLPMTGGRLENEGPEMSREMDDMLA